MKIKQYLGTDMRDALRQIRQELGADAVILSTRSLAQGVEVSAAADTNTQSAAVGTVAAAPPPLAAPTAVATAEQLAVSGELRTLRQLLERQLAALAWNDYTRREPLRARALAELTELGVTRDIALQVIDELPAELSATQAERLHLELLARRLAVCAAPTDVPGALVLLGAAGSGKTTMLAKLALRWLLEHNDDGLAIVTIDDEHIGAAEQARSLGRLLGVPSFRFASGGEFAAAADRFADQQLVLVDTPALGADPAPAAELAAALAGTRLPMQSMLLLPASAQHGVLDELVRRARPFAPACCALTRCDEAVRFGGVLSTLARSGLPAAYLSEGSRIPDDLCPARAEQLVTRAVELSRRAGTGLDAELLAQHFGGHLNATAA